MKKIPLIASIRLETYISMFTALLCKERRGQVLSATSATKF